MGRATRWLKSFFVIKSPTHHNQPNSDAGSGCRSSHMGGSGRDSGGICNNPATIPPNITASEAAWLNLYYMDKEQSKHAVTVAAAAAAAADAAVAAAQAAVAVVRLANNGRERWAAVKVQATFRGYLARKALRALKGLVKIQALVRGYLVRKQATATFHSMQALFRAQATIRSKRVHGLAYMGPHYPRPALSTRQSVEIFDDSGSEHTASLHSKRLSASFDSKIISVVDNSSPKIVEVDTGRPRCRPRRPNTSFSGFDANPFYHTPHQTRLSIPTWHDTNWGSTKDDFRSSTAQSTPRFTNYNRPHPPTTPTKSVGGEKCKNYMAKTQCFEAKVRSQSAPKQRPEPSPMSKKRNSISGVRMQLRSCSKSQEVVNFKNAVMGTLNKSLDQTIR